MEKGRGPYPLGKSRYSWKIRISKLSLKPFVVNCEKLKGDLKTAEEIAAERGLPHTVGTVLSSDLFYGEGEAWRIWEKMGTLAVEMESFALYCNAARAGVRALGIFSVSDNLVTRQELSAQQRQTGFTSMMEVALETACRISRQAARETGSA